MSNESSVRRMRSSQQTENGWLGILILALDLFPTVLTSESTNMRREFFTAAMVVLHI